MSNCTEQCSYFVYQSYPPQIECDQHGYVTKECCLECCNPFKWCNCEDARMDCGDDQDILLDSVSSQVISKLEKTKNGKFSVHIPYGTTEENKRLVAEWLAVNFENAVKCFHNMKFVTLNKNMLCTANVYYVDLNGYSPRKKLP